MKERGGGGVLRTLLFLQHEDLYPATASQFAPSPPPSHRKGNSPLPHDEGVVNRQAVNIVNAHALDLLIVVLVPGKVSGRAGGSERSGEGEEDDALSLEEVVGGEGLPVEGVGVGDGADPGAGLEGNVGDLGPLGDGSGEGGGEGDVEGGGEGGES